MRQAGRYLPGYRKLKEKYTILDMIRNPEMAAKVCISPIDILGVDAAILFADIMTPLIGIGIDLKIVDDIGPVITEPFTSEYNLNKIRRLHPEEDIPYLLKTIRILKKELKVPLIGFSGAPFTLASYLIEGAPSRDFVKTKFLMYNYPSIWHKLMERLTETIIVYLKYQVKGGVDALQLFDSWVGWLNTTDYKEYVFPYTQKICIELSNPRIPLIHFGVNTASLLSTFSHLTCNVIGVDFRVDISYAWKEIGLKKAVQGNLDPALLLADFPLIKKRVDELFDSLPKREGFIFNLGHGVIKDTPVDNLKRLTEYVHQIPASSL